MTGETPTNSSESLSHGELLTEVVDMKLPPELEHQPIEDAKGAVRAVQRSTKLVEGDPHERKYLHISITAGTESGDNVEYKVREDKGDRASGGRTFKWNQGDDEVTVSYLAGKRVTRAATPQEAEDLVTRVYDAQVYRADVHKAGFKLVTTEKGPAVAVNLPDDKRGWGRTVLKKIIGR